MIISCKLCISQGSCSFTIADCVISITCNLCKLSVWMAAWQMWTHCKFNAYHEKPMSKWNLLLHHFRWIHTFLCFIFVLLNGLCLSYYNYYINLLSRCSIIVLFKAAFLKMYCWLFSCQLQNSQYKLDFTMTMQEW